MRQLDDFGYIGSLGLLIVTGSPSHPMVRAQQRRYMQPGASRWHAPVKPSHARQSNLPVSYVGHKP